MGLSARNQIKGTVVRSQEGAATPPQCSAFEYREAAISITCASTHEAFDDPSASRPAAKRPWGERAPERPKRSRWD